MRSRWLIPSAGRGGRAGRALIVMVEPVDDWTGDDPPFDVRGPRDRLLLGDSLMWPGLTIEGDKLGEEAPQVLRVEQEHVVEQLVAKGANKALGEGVHVRRAHGAADDADAGALECCGDRKSVV